jgi:hypothetical protein
VASSVLMRFNNASVLILLSISGMKPELSINYNSNSGNGLLGVGFGLGGLSAIHRCSKTIAIDGVILLSILIFIIVNPWLCALFLQILS